LSAARSTKKHTNGGQGNWAPRGAFFPENPQTKGVQHVQPYRRRKDLLVAEGASGELVVMERRTYYPPRLPKPQAVTVLPPPRKPLTITITSTTTRTTNREDPLPSTPHSPF
jgi:hypothetical protein